MAGCQGPAARASMDKKTPKKNRHSESPAGGGGGFRVVGTHPVPLPTVDQHTLVILPPLVLGDPTPPNAERVTRRGRVDTLAGCSRCCGVGCRGAPRPPDRCGAGSTTIRARREGGWAGGGGGGGGARGHDELGGMCRPRCPRRGRSGVARHGITASRRGRSGGRRRRAFDQAAMFVLQAQGSPRSRSHQRAVPMWAGSSNFRRRAPVSHEKQGPHHCRVAIIHLHPLRHLTYHQHRRPPSDGDPNPRSPLPPVSLPRPFAECNFAPLRAEGAQQLMLCSGVSEWPIQDKEATFKELLVLGVTAEEARDVAGTALG